MGDAIEHVTETNIRENQLSIFARCTYSCQKSECAIDVPVVLYDNDGNLHQVDCSRPFRVSPFDAPRTVINGSGATGGYGCRTA